jgi:hypothetical protein
MQTLNFPVFQFRFSEHDGRQLIFDPVRRRFVSLTPEEWVRQHMIAYMVETKQIPLSMIGVEKKLLVNGLVKRFDIAVFSRTGFPVLLVECKAPFIGISEKVFDQAARYNMQLQVNYFVITNGMEHFYCRIDYLNKAYRFIEDIPLYSALIHIG